MCQLHNHDQLRFYLHGERVARYAEGCLLCVGNPLVCQDERDGVPQPEGNSLKTVEEEKDQNVNFVSIQILQHLRFFLEFAEETLFRGDRGTLVLVVFIFLEFNIRHVRLLGRHVVSCLPHHHQEQYNPPPQVKRCLVRNKSLWELSEAQETLKYSILL